MPQIIKKHTHTRTIYKHHFIKPKTPKSLSHSPSILQTIAASPSSLKLSNSASLLKALPTLSDGDGITLGLGKNIWRPSASEYRASELNYIPQKMKFPKKKNPFKMLEVMAEAHAEGHELPTHVVKKLKPSLPTLLDDDDSQTSEYIPDYMLANSDLYNTDDNSASDSDSSRPDLIYVAPQQHHHHHDKYKAKKTSFIPSKMVLSPTLATLANYKKKPKMTYDWLPGTISTSLSSTSSTASDSSNDSDDVSDLKHHFQMMKRNKTRKPKRLSPTLGPSEDHINFLQMTRKPYSISNFTKYKNRLSAAASSLNTSI